MNMHQYQEAMCRTFYDERGAHPGIAYLTIGLAGETGEVCELVKKHMRHRIAPSQDDVKSELGDVLWYLTAICEWWGLKLEDVAQANVAKLQARYPDGFKQGGGKR